MSLAKPAALFVCLALAGCAGKSHTDNALAKESRPTHGGEERVQVEAAKPQQVAQRAERQTTSPVRKVEQNPAGKKSSPSALRAESKPLALASKSADGQAAVAASAKRENALNPPAGAKSGSGWWLFGSKDEKQVAPSVPASKGEAKKAPQVSKAWLDDNEKRLKAAVTGSKFQVERRGDLLVVVAPADVSFNPDRPSMLMPSTLGPLSRVAKLVAQDQQSAVLVLGHGDSSGDALLNRKLSLERAQAMASIFRMSGLKNDRLMLRGLGASKPRASNEDARGRAQNRRVELILTLRDSLPALVAQSER